MQEIRFEANSIKDEDSDRWLGQIMMKCSSGINMIVHTTTTSFLTTDGAEQSAIVEFSEQLSN